MKHTKGDKVKVIARKDGHGFKLGDIVTIDRVYSNDYRAFNDKTYWQIQDDEIENIKQTNMKNKNIEIKKEDFHNFYDSLCDEYQEKVRKLCPDEFEDEIKYNSEKLYAYARKGLDGLEITLLREGSDYKMFWSVLNTTYNKVGSAYNTAQEALNEYKHEGIQVFDNQKDFFTWALKQVS